jgi:hypothetical protein
MLCACLLATLAFVPQDPPPGPPALERIDALIAKTNACEHFVATYKYWNKDGEEGQVRLAYRAPDMGLFEMQGGKSGLQQYVSAGTIVIRGRNDDGSTMAATIKSVGLQNQLSESSIAWLEEYFPRKAGAPRREPRSGLVFRISVDNDCEGLTVNLGMGSGDLLAWLQEMKRRPAQVASDAGAANDLVYTPCEKARLVVSAESGFVTRLEKLAPEGTNVRIQFVSLDLDGPLDAAIFTPPPPAAGAQDMSAAYEAMSSAAMFTQVRGDVYRALARRLDEEALVWNDESRPKIQKLLRRVDEELVGAANAPMIAHLEERVDSLASELEQKLAGASPALRQQVLAGASKDRAGLEAQLKTLQEKLFAQKPPGLVCKLRPSLGEDLLALEGPILGEVFAEKIAKPLLARFDGKLAKRLDEK